ncbi:hypothetical protein [Paraburkholderia sp. HD33-4]|uniref:hypothetical protein n=1 Tax=Paraburkholderia sp. HD33-4 TaxID=2883242 RepID=UPI001F2F5857|nr:hypothetical protein [Paraburkholderia sp. HD33-4]
MDEIAFAKVQIAEAEVAEQATQSDRELRRLKEAAEASRAHSAAVEAILVPRVALGQKADTLIRELGETLVALQRTYDEAQASVARGMHPTESLALIWNHEAIGHAAIGALFRATGWDAAVLQGLSSNGLSLLPQADPLAVVAGHQNALLTSIRGQRDMQYAMALEQAEERHQEAA